MNKYSTHTQFLDIWISKIPAHWQARKMKHLFSERSEKGYPNEPLLVASQNMGVVPKNVYGNRTVEAQKDLHLLKLVHEAPCSISSPSQSRRLVILAWLAAIETHKNMILQTTNKWWWWVSQIRQANLKFLPVLTQQQAVIGNRCSQKLSKLG